MVTTTRIADPFSTVRFSGELRVAHLNILNSPTTTDSALAHFARMSDPAYQELIAAHRNASPETVEVTVKSALRSVDTLMSMYVFYEAVRSGKTSPQTDGRIEFVLDEARKNGELETSVRKRAYMSVKNALVAKQWIAAKRED